MASKKGKKRFVKSLMIALLLFLYKIINGSLGIKSVAAVTYMGPDEYDTVKDPFPSDGLDMVVYMGPQPSPIGRDWSEIGVFAIIGLILLFAVIGLVSSVVFVYKKIKNKKAKKLFNQRKK